MTLAQLKELKVSTPAEPSGIYHIPTLGEVLELMRTTDMMVNIELKNSICFYPGMEGGFTASVNLAPSFFEDHLKFNINAKFMNGKNRYADTGAAIGGALALSLIHIY